MAFFWQKCSVVSRGYAMIARKRYIKYFKYFKLRYFYQQFEEVGHLQVKYFLSLKSSSDLRLNAFSAFTATLNYA